MTKKKYPPVKVGNEYGKLTVIEKAASSTRQDKWICRCSCGKQTTSFGFSLKSDRAKSCGCIAAQMSKDRWKNATPEMIQKRIDMSKRTHSMSKHGAYRSWSDMKSRCLVSGHKWFKSYGGRGIKICNQWMEFETFWKDLGPTWFQGAQIGRINNDGNYEPSNVQWETSSEQQSNKSNNVFVETKQGRMTLSEASRFYGVTRSCIAHRIKASWPLDKIFQKSQRAAS